MGRALFHLIFYIGIVLAPVVLSTVLASDFHNFFYELGKCCALAGFMILSLEILLASRIKWIERAFGLDILIRYHKHMAIFGTALLVFHPLLLAGGGGGWKLIIGLDLPVIILLGKLTLFILIVNILLSSYQTPLKLKFEKWRLIHDILGPLILLFGFSHSFFIGEDLQRAHMQALWLVTILLAACIYIYHRILRPLILKRRLYRVEDVRRESKDVWTVTLTPPEGKSIAPYLPGQFHFITFYRGRNLPVEEHHWTISSSPSQKDHVSSTIKALGDFTSTIGETMVGDKAAVQGAFGRFSYVLHPHEKDLVFIAGGIGITPLMSMLRHMRDTRKERSVLLLYANPSEDGIVFRKELDEMEKGGVPSLKVVHVLSRPGQDWTGEKGHVDREKIERYTGDNIQEKVFYICGPPKMRKDVIASLKGVGVADRNIRMEIFSFLD